jgi:hypothetical protein
VVAVVDHAECIHDTQQSQNWERFQYVLKYLQLNAFRRQGRKFVI